LWLSASDNISCKKKSESILWTKITRSQMSMTVLILYITKFVTVLRKVSNSGFEMKFGVRLMWVKMLHLIHSIQIQRDSSNFLPVSNTDFFHPNFNKLEPNSINK
jgi:hypothetical protein